MGRFIEKNDKPWLWSGGGIGAGLAIGFALAHIQTLQEWRWDIIAQPLATLGAGIAAIIAAAIALYNGEKTREQDKEIHEAKSRAEQERILRERFTSIVEMLSTNSEDYTKRESGAYALAALADDWAVFHEDDPESAQQEQQVCLNILINQLHDPIPEKSSPQLLLFKKRVQDIIFSKFDNRKNKNGSPWSNLELDLSNSFFYNLQIIAIFEKPISFSSSIFEGKINFSNTQFHNHADFSSCHFNGGARFDNTTFEKSALFRYASFEDFASFHKATFKEEFMTDGTHFNGSSIFTFANFFFGIYFSDTHLNEGPAFNNAKFSSLESDPSIEQLKLLNANLTGAKFGVNFSK